MKTTRAAFGPLKYLLHLILMTACVEQIDIEDYAKSEPSGQLVIEGLITDEKKRHEVKLSRTSKAIPESSYEAVSEAEVTITDGVSIFSLIEGDEAGIYLTDSIQGEVNATYTLTVITEGKVYQASDRMVPVDSFGRAEAIILGSKNPPKGFIQSPMIVYGTNAPALISITVDNPKEGDKYKQIEYYTFPGIDPDHLLPKFVEGFLSYDLGTQITQAKYSLSPEHYQFTRAVLLETEYKGGIFGSVRSNVPTNCSNGAFGFFAACEKITRTGVIGEDGTLH